MLIALPACAEPPQSVPNDESTRSAAWEKATAAVGAKLLPHAFLKLDGDPSTTVFANGHPTAILLFTGQDCLSCGPLVLDAWELDRWSKKAGASLLIVISTDSLGAARRFVKSAHLPVEPVLDTSGWLTAGFGGVVHPIAVLVGPHGTILAVHNRAPRYANSRFLRTTLVEMGEMFK